MMNRISKKILIVFSILIRCSLSFESTENGTFDSLMYTSNDLQCLAETPIGDLMKIRKAIRMMNAVSIYDAHRLSTATALQNDNQNQSDSELRELPGAEARNVFQYFHRYTTSTTKSPLAEPFMMSSQVHDAMRNNHVT